MKMKYGNQVGKSVWHQKDGSKASFTAKKIKKNASSAKIVKTGVFNQWYPNGKLRSIETYRNGVKDGPYSKYYDNGQESQKGIFERDKKVVVKGVVERKWNQRQRVIFSRRRDRHFHSVRLV